MNIRFAFAVNSDNKFIKEHFGDADKYMIYEVADDKIYFVHSEQNLLKDHNEEEEHHHGDPKKGKRIIKFLLDRRIDAIVAKQFGKNIALVRDHFLPIIISDEAPVEVKRMLSSRLDIVKESLKKSQGPYKPVNGREWS